MKDQVKMKIVKENANIQNSNKTNQGGVYIFKPFKWWKSRYEGLQNRCLPS
jgi:hypothetical protein